jgi:predicted phage terminase large subunit-like protein
MIVSDHHKVIIKALVDVMLLKKKRLIINIPPGYSKTEVAVISFIAYGIAVNPMCKFLHLSYSDSLALENSDVARGIIKSTEFQKMWAIKLKKDSDSKKKWWTENNGGVYATGAGGQVTGFRAGHMIEDVFTGALVVDDPIKPDDAKTEERIKVNKRFLGTVKSRLALERTTPIIVIMQRLHKNDLSGFLLKGGSGEKWHHLNLPVLINNAKPYSKKYTHGIPIKHNLTNGWLWPLKHNESDRKTLKASKEVYHCQYMQDPESYVVEGAMFKQHWIDDNRVSAIDGIELVEIVVAIDPSGDDGVKKGEEDDEGKIKKNDSDIIGIGAAGRCKDGHYYVLEDASTGGSPLEWGKKSIETHEKYLCNGMVWESNFGGAMVKSNIRTIEGGKKIKMLKVTASRGKLVRAEPVSALYENNLVHHVGDDFELLEDEMTGYDGKGRSPNRLDWVVWAILHLSRGHVNSTEAPDVNIFG